MRQEACHFGDGSSAAKEGGASLEANKRLMQPTLDDFRSVNLDGELTAAAGQYDPELGERPGAVVISMLPPCCFTTMS